MRIVCAWLQPNSVTGTVILHDALTRTYCIYRFMHITDRKYILIFESLTKGTKARFAIVD